MTTLYALQTPDGDLTLHVGEDAAQAEYDYLNDKWDSVRVFRVSQLVDMTRVFEE